MPEGPSKIEHNTVGERIKREEAMLKQLEQAMVADTAIKLRNERRTAANAGRRRFIGNLEFPKLTGFFLSERKW